MARQSSVSRKTTLAPRGQSRGVALSGFLQSRKGVALLAALLTWAVLTFSSRLNASSREFAVRKADLGSIKATKHGKQNQEKLLVLTPLKDASPWLDDYFARLRRLNYPPSLISLAFLVSDSEDSTLERLTYAAAAIAALPKEQQYADFTILRKDFGFTLPADVRHAFEGQPVRRSFIARARNYLVTAALGLEHAYVLWLDVDVTGYDPDILTDLMSIDKDVVVPNTLWHLEDSWDFWGFDKNNWQETEESLKLLKKLTPDTLLVEGYRELETHRLHMVDMPTHLGLAHVPLDGIGCTFALVKAHVHREGVMFPSFVFDNAIETEGFAKMAKKAGFEVVGVPGILIFHAVNH